jgi:hypothetical protein
MEIQIPGVDDLEDEGLGRDGGRERKPLVDKRVATSMKVDPIENDSLPEEGRRISDHAGDDFIRSPPVHSGPGVNIGPRVG